MVIFGAWVSKISRVAKAAHEGQRHEQEGDFPQRSDSQKGIVNWGGPRESRNALDT